MDKRPDALPLSRTLGGTMPMYPTVAPSNNAQIE